MRNLREVESAGFSLLIREFNVARNLFIQPVIPVLDPATITQAFCVFHVLTPILSGPARLKIGYSAFS